MSEHEERNDQRSGRTELIKMTVAIVVIAGAWFGWKYLGQRGSGDEVLARFSMTYNAYGYAMNGIKDDPDAKTALRAPTSRTPP